MRNTITKIFLAVTAIIGASAHSAFAQLPPEVSSTIVSLTTNAIEFGQLMLIAIAAVAGIVLGIRLLPAVVKRVASWLR